MLDYVLINLQKNVCKNNRQRNGEMWMGFKTKKNNFVYISVFI